MLVGVSCFALGALCHQWISLRRVTPSSISTSGGSGDTTAAAEKRAIAARAVDRGVTAPPPAELAGRALREGWIHVPAAGSLAGLASV